MRWGITAPIVTGLKTRSSCLPNVQDAENRLWRRLLETPAQRCLVPVTSFAVRQDPKRRWRINWFASDESRPLMFCPGIWQEWRGELGTARSSSVGKHLLFSILTTETSPDIPNNQHAVPVVLLDQTSCNLWMTAPIGQAILLQTSLPAGSFKQVATNKRLDHSEVADCKPRRSTSKASAVFLQTIRAASKNGGGLALSPSSKGCP